MSFTTSLLAHPGFFPFSQHYHGSLWVPTTSRHQTIFACPGLPCLGISGLDLLVCVRAPCLSQLRSSFSGSARYV